MLLLRLLCWTVFDVVRYTVKFGSDMPRPSEWIGKFVNFTLRSTWAQSLASKDNITNWIYFGVGSMCVDKVTVHCLLFFIKDAGNLAQGLEMLGKLPSIWLNCDWSCSKFSMFVWWEVNGKLEILTESNKTAQEISAQNGDAIPCIKEEEDGLHSNPNRTPFIAHYFQAFVEVAVDLFDHHGVVIATR